MCELHLATFKQCTGELRAASCHSATTFGMEKLEHVQNTKFGVILRILW